MLANTNKSDDSKASSYQVLNISNVNAQNEIVLNDEQLLELIQSYPFIYNPHVRTFGDADYENWAWEQIAKSFNRLYEKMDRNVWYTSTELMERWKELQPIVRSLAKISNVRSLPDSLRSTIVKISMPMDERPNEIPKINLSPAQKTLLKYLPVVQKMSMEKRRCLEAEMMELILSSELESKGTIKPWPADLETINKECDEIIKELKLNDLDTISNHSYVHSLSVEKQKQQSQNEHLNFDAIDIVNDTENLRILIPKTEINLGSPDNSQYTLNTKQIQQIQKTKWVPLQNWQKYVRKCKVRVKRTIIEDDIPLAHIKRERNDS